MSFKEWALANPTRTKDYVRIQGSLRMYNDWKIEASKKVKDLSSGLLPEVEQPTSVFGSMFSNLMRSAFVIAPPTFYQEYRLKSHKYDQFQIKYWVHEYRKVEAKKQQQRQWEREAVEAKRDNEIRLKVYRESAERDVSRYQDKIDEIELELKNYKIDESIFDWYPPRFWMGGERWSRFVDCLNERLAPLGYDELSAEEDNLANMLEVACTFPLCLQINIWNTEYDEWFVKLTDGDGIRVIRQTSDGLTMPHEIAFGHALMVYLEQCWDKLITKYDEIYSLCKL